MTTIHHRLVAPVLALAGSGAILGDLLCTPHDRSVWDELGLGLLTMALVSMNYQLSRR